MSLCGVAPFTCPPARAEPVSAGRASVIRDVRSGQEYTVPGQWARIYGDVLAWSEGSAVYWMEPPD